MKVLAFDQASEITGYVVFDKKGALEESKMLEYGKVDLKKINAQKRVPMMILNILSLIDEFVPDTVIIEDVAMQRNVQTVIMLARIQGAIMGHCYQKGISLIIRAPSSWRMDLQFIQGRGVHRGNLKKQAQDKVKEVFGLEVSEDEADAICIGLSTILANNIEEVLNNGK